MSFAILTHLFPGRTARERIEARGYRLEGETILKHGLEFEIKSFCYRLIRDLAVVDINSVA